MTFEQNPQMASAPAPYVVIPSGVRTDRPVLGITALVIAIAVMVLSIVASILIGIVASSIVSITGSSDPSSAFQTGYAAGSSPKNVGLGVGVLAHIVLGTLAGGAALILGIIAITLKRGRPQGIAAVSIAVAAPILSFIVYFLVAGVGAAMRLG